MHIKCAIFEDQRDLERIKGALEVVVGLFSGSGDDPTEDKPVVVNTTREGKQETTVKKVLDVEYEARVKALAESSMRIASENRGLLERMKTELESEEAGEDIHG